ncbi:MAG: F0F1 ATP synthase subunit B [Gemmatimonadetes bacterium]|nr:F0F1 ATP synthase subunit B [Gemmatimonadota bacterium]
MMLSLLPLLQEAEHAAEGALPAPFSPTWGLFIWTWVVFIPLLFLLSKLVYPTIVKMTADREAAIAKQLADAKAAHAAAEAALAEQRTLLADARGEAQALLADARQAAERERHTALERTRAEQDEILARAKQEIAAERDRAKAELRREAVDLAIAAAGKVIERELDQAADRKIVEDYLSQIGGTA